MVALLVCVVGRGPGHARSRPTVVGSRWRSTELPSMAQVSFSISRAMQRTEVWEGLERETGQSGARESQGNRTRLTVGGPQGKGTLFLPGEGNRDRT